MIVKIFERLYNAETYFIGSEEITINETFHVHRFSILESTPIWVNGELIHGDKESGISALFG